MLKNTKILVAILLAISVQIASAHVVWNSDPEDVNINTPTWPVTNSCNATNGLVANIVWCTGSHSYYNTNPSSTPYEFPEDVNVSARIPSICMASNGSLHATTLAQRDPWSYILEYRQPTIWTPETVQIGPFRCPKITVTANRIHILYTKDTTEMLPTTRIRHTYRNRLSRTWRTLAVNSQQNAQFGANIVSNGNNLHATWTTADHSIVYYDRSTNDGTSWSFNPDKEVYTRTGDMLIFDNPAIAVNGNNVYIAWVEHYGSGYLRFAQSTDNGTNWTVNLNPLATGLKNDGKISVAVSRRTNPNIYIVYSTYDDQNGLALTYYESSTGLWITDQITFTGIIGIYGQSISVNYNAFDASDCIDVVWGVGGSDIYRQRGNFNYIPEFLNSCKPADKSSNLVKNQTVNHHLLSEKQLKFNLNLPTMNPVNFRMYDIMGKKVADITKNPTTTTYTMAYNTQNLPAGVYIVNIWQDDKMLDNEQVILVK